MDWTTFWIFIHILVMAFWLGGDMGAYYAAKLFVRTEYSPETRAVLARVMQGVDIFPRLSMVLVLPTGMTLAARTGISPVDGGWLTLLWILSLTWLFLVWNVHRPTAPEWGKKLQGLDTLINWVLLVVVMVAAIGSLVSNHPFTETWLAVKVFFYGITFVILIAVNMMLKPFGPAFARLLSEGSSPEVEAIIKGSIDKSKPMIWAIWAIVVINTAIGLFKPVF
jgi:hypothetical protein